MKWVGRILGGIAGFFAIVFGLTMIFGEPVLPGCEQAQTTDVLRGIVADRALSMPIPKVPKEEIMTALEIADITEASFDEDKQVRVCKAVLSLKVQESPVYNKLKIGYTITWQNRKEGMFRVEAKVE